MRLAIPLRRGLLRACVLAAGAAGAAALSGAHAAEPAAPLKVCADPDNLPFSSAGAGAKGFYMELAERLGAALERPVEPVWYPTELGKRAVRSTLLARRCDVFIGLPAEGGFMKPQVAMSRPFAVFRYALVTPAGGAAAEATQLRGLRVAVQLSTPPHLALAQQDGVTTLTVLSPEEGMRALAEGRADAAWLWGPTAGWLNQSLYHGSYRVRPTDGPDMAWPVAMGLRRDDAALRQQLDGQVEALAPAIEALEAKYGFPDSRPADPVAAAPASSFWQVAGRVVEALLGVRGARAQAADEPVVARGRELFNANCSHCHGPNAESPDKRIDLRRLTKRYGDDKDQVFTTTVHAGRPDKGMPTWGGVLAEDDITSIKRFIDSVQAPG